MPNLFRSQSAAPWSPFLMGGLVAFWDSIQTEKFTIVSGAISAWTPIIGSATATQATSSKRPVSSARNGRSAVSFDGTDDFLSLDDSSFPVNGDACTMGVVGYVDAAAGTTLARRLFSYGAASPTTSPRALRLSYSSPNLRPALVAGTASGAVVVDATGTDQIMVGRFPTGSQKRLSSNGTDANATTATCATTAGNAAIGALGDGTVPFYGLINCVLLTNGFSSNSETRKFEGWAAWRYNMSASLLPASHPFRGLRPMASADEIERFMDERLSLQWSDQFDLDQATKLYTPVRRLIVPDGGWRVAA